VNPHPQVAGRPVWGGRPNGRRLFHRVSAGWGCFVTAVLILSVGLAIVAGLVSLMVRMNRVNRRRSERRREAWKAAGGVDACPDDYIGRGYTSPPH
jgi:hypothetical protein